LFYLTVIFLYSAFELAFDARRLLLNLLPDGILLFEFEFVDEVAHVLIFELKLLEGRGIRWKLGSRDIGDCIGVIGIDNTEGSRFVGHPLNQIIFIENISSY
jgi:hypothetical protein